MAMSDSTSTAVQAVVNKRVGGQDGRAYCSAPHPEDNTVWCRRQKNHPEDFHAAYVFSIIEPEEWPVEHAL